MFMNLKDNKDVNEPLVSIIVVTYNSSKWIFETLESAKKQTYGNVELIVSDDCSTDDTVIICKEWIKINKHRFVRTELLTTKKNTGIAPNVNRGLKAANGEWVKGIAGDDILLDNCIEININATKSSELLFYFSKNKILTNSDDTRKSFEDWYEVRYQYFIGNQFDNLMNFGYYFPTVTFFANRKEFEKIGFYDERYPFHEDFPMWFKILKLGYTFHFIDEFTVKYRVSGESIFQNNSRITSVLWHKSTKKFYYNEFFKEQIRYKKYLEAFDKFMKFIYLDLTIAAGNKPGFLDKCCNKVRLLSPLYLGEYVKNFVKIRIKRESI